MPISFSCESCGRSLRVRDELAGQEIYCPDCRSILTVPAANGAISSYRPQTVAPSADQGDALAARAEERTNPLPEPPKAADVDEWLPPQRTPRRGSTSRPSTGSATTSIGGGLVMMLIGVVAFGLGLIVLGRVFVYPIILFVVGVVALIKGIVGAASDR
jgi:hypothetical protein